MDQTRAMPGISRLIKTIKESFWLLSHVGELRVRISEMYAFMQNASQQNQQQRWLEAGDLRAFERQVYSQNGEDGIIQEILYRIGTSRGFFLEFGVESGIECNCARLALEEHWDGVFIESDETHFKELRNRYRDFKGVQCVNACVTSLNIETLLEANHVPPDFDLLSIDIDGNDYWVWSAITRWHPRIVVIEYNAALPPTQKRVMQENINHRWDGTSYYGASLASLAALGREKGYELVATNSRGVNAFFVTQELVTCDKFLDPHVHYHYSPPSYGNYLGAHPPRSGPWIEK